MWLALALLVALTPASRLTEAPRLLKAPAPEVAVTATGGGLVLLDARLDADGSVDEVRVLASSSPYSEALRAVAPQFRFRAARAGEDPAPAHVLVAGYFRPPALLLTDAPAVPRGLPRAPVALPVAVTPPAYPPGARGGATVVVDVRIDARGVVTSAAVIEAAPAFDPAAVAAARAWRFEPPEGGGPSAAVLVFVFREPADIGPAPPR